MNHRLISGRTFSAIAAVLAALSSTGLALSAAQAQDGALSALRSHDTRQPIDIEAARAEVRDQDSTAQFSGNVQVTQGAMGLRSERIRVLYDREGERLTILRIDADGGVRLTSPSESASAAWGIYDVEREQLTMGGNVTLTRGSQTISGQRLELNLRTGVSSMDGTTTGGGGDGSRVRARFTPPARPATP